MPVSIPLDQIREELTISQLPHTNEPSHILVKHLESAAVLFRLTGVAEATRTVEDFLEGLEVD
jgi:hypothetical protein